MSDFVSQDMLPGLWEGVLKCHWDFLNTEESMKKLEERKKLELCLKEFLCMAPHDRKFFLPETSYVLKKTIKELDNFSAYKAMIGFESISQYANNLFTKPWRREYKVIKMYSGFYQHEIKSNLFDADKLFEAMGYKKLPNQILMLDGPICPDQVLNVSRDAMTAYVECQIMKQIFCGINAKQLSCSWLDIYQYRENYIGGIFYVVEALAYLIQGKRYRKEDPNLDNFYTSIQQTPQTHAMTQCLTCSHACHPTINHISTCSQHSYPQQSGSIQGYGNICSIHSNHQGSSYIQMGQTMNTSYKGGGIHLGPHQMTHSKSLEHYSESVNPMDMFPHRHSFDQPCESIRSHYDNGFDYTNCINGYSHHPYNVSGNRYPLPYNISNQLNNPLSTNSCNLSSVPHYVSSQPSAIVSCGHKVQLNDPYRDYNGYTHDNQCHYFINGNKDLINYRQCNYAINGKTNNIKQNDHLIDFSEGHNDINVHHYNRSRDNNFDITNKLNGNPYNLSRHKIRLQSQVNDISKTQLSENIKPKDLRNKNTESSGIDEIDSNFHNLSSGRIDKKTTIKKTADKYSRSLLEQQCEKISDNNEYQPKKLHSSFESYDDTIKSRNIGVKITDFDENDSIRSLTNKNQDGVGSFESWDYVFQNLEKNGYNKDLGERGDLFVRGLNLDSINISNNTEKRRSRSYDNKIRISNEITNTKLSEMNELNKENFKIKTNDSQEHNDINQITLKISQPVQKLRSPKSIVNNNSNSNNYNNNNNNLEKSMHDNMNSFRKTKNQNTSDKLYMNGKIPSNSNNTVNKNNLSDSISNEWSCRVCTFLNSDKKRICEMCCRSKDFNVDANNSPTCV